MPLTLPRSACERCPLGEPDVGRGSTAAPGRARGRPVDGASSCDQGARRAPAPWGALLTVLVRAAHSPGPRITAPFRIHIYQKKISGLAIPPHRLIPFSIEKQYPTWRSDAGVRAVGGAHEACEQGDRPALGAAAPWSQDEAPSTVRPRVLSHAASANGCDPCFTADDRVQRARSLAGPPCLARRCDGCTTRRARSRRNQMEVVVRLPMSTPRLIAPIFR